MAEYCNQYYFGTDNQEDFEMVPDQPASFEDWLNRPGPYFQPAVNADGYLYWTNNGGLPNPEPVRIVGRDGRGITLTGQCETVAELPEDPDQGEAWAVGSEEPFECYAWFGEWVDMGLLFPAGQDGVSPTVTMTAITGGTRLTITDKEHPGGQSTDIMNGSPGNPGQDGVSPAVSMEAITGGTRLTITDKDHPSGQSTDIMNGSAGHGVPAGGSAGQFLRKASGTDYDAEWYSPAAGDVSYDSSLTYAAGTVGEELSSQRNTLDQLDEDKAEKADLTNIIQTRPNCTVPNGISAGTYFYLDGVLTRAIVAIAENAAFTSSNSETVAAGGLNAIGASVPNSNLDVGIYQITFQELSIGNFVFDQTVYISPGSLREASIILHNANGTYWLSFEIYLSGGVLSAYGARYSTVSDTSIGNPATVNVIAVRKIK